MTGGTFSSQSLGTLTALEDALTQLRAFVPLLQPQCVPLPQALGRILARDVVAASALPATPRALRDGYAVSSHMIVGASSYAPVILPNAPQRIAIGESVPADCDCIIDAANVDFAGPIAQILAEAYPGEGLRRVGEDAPADALLLRAGQRLTACDLMIAREAGYASLDLRVPRVKIYNAGEAHISSDFITASLATYGAWVEASPTLDFSSADLILTIGGTGDGSADHMIEVLRAQCDLLCHGLACAPSRSMAIARHGSVPVIAIPGTPADALASLHFIIKPVLTMLSACSSELTLRLPLAQKIASRVGIAELALLARRDECFVPLAVGDMPLRLMAEATHLCYLPAASEGHAAGEMIDAFSVSEAAA